MSPDPETPARPRQTEGERRQLTVMFCDLIGSTRLSQMLDPEDLREILNAYQQACTEAVQRYDGYVAQYLGDGVLVYFGFPQAHEDDAERAIRAALAVQTSLAALNQRPGSAHAEPIEARLGVHTGLVVVAEVGAKTRHETLALGETINITARLEQLAEPGGIVISEATLRLVPGRFVTRDLGTPPLKGVETPIRVFAVDGYAGVTSRFGLKGSLTPLAGREWELAQLEGGWVSACEGRGQVVTVSGEAGIGKSRILHAFGEQIADQQHFTLEMGCSPYTKGSAFQPWIELLHNGLGLSDDDAPEDKLAMLEDRLGNLPGLDLANVIPFLGVLLELPESERFPLDHIGRELQREKTMQAMLAPIVALARIRPLVLVFEDLHWSDPSTTELLGRLIDEVPTLRVLLLLTFRPTFEPTWSERSHLSSLRLQRLTKQQTLAVVRNAIEAASDLHADVIDALVERADGVPLFAEELVRSVVESSSIIEPGQRGRSDVSIPSTLQDSLMARLDLLSAAKPVAQLAATLGRTFSFAMIEGVAEVEGSVLRNGLLQLVNAEILFQNGVPPEATYTFKHALLQDTAYESQLKGSRRELHARIASVLEKRFPQRVEAEPEIVARHSAAGGLFIEAVDYYKKAGEQAVVRLAYLEATGYFARALEQLAHTQQSNARHEKEIELRLAQASPLSAMRGYDDPELVDSIHRVEQLCDEIGTGPQQIPALLGLTLSHTHMLPKAREYATSLLAVAEPLGIAPLCVAGYMIKGTGALTSATIAEACSDLKQALDIAETTEFAPPTAAFDIDVKAMACCTYAIALVLSGRPDTAIEYANRGVERGRELGHLRTLASVLQNGATAFHMMGDAQRCGELSDQCLEEIEGRGFHEVEVSARVLGGWAHAHCGDRAAIPGMEAALQSAAKHGVLAGMTQMHFASAEVHALTGDYERAFEAMDRGEAIIERTGEHVGYEPQALLTRATMMLDAGAEDMGAIESMLFRAIELCERSQAPWITVCVATRLGRIAIATGKGALEARERLQRICAEITEGAETQRMRQARAMIDELGARRI